MITHHDLLHFRKLTEHKYTRSQLDCVLYESVLIVTAVKQLYRGINVLMNNTVAFNTAVRLIYRYSVHV